MIPDFIEQEMNDIVELIKNLVSIPTESPEGAHYKKFIDLLEAEVKKRIPEFQT